MAGITIRRDVHITTGMAVHALQRHMHAGQRELGLIMVEGGRRPAGSIVALRTVESKIVRHVIRIRNRVVICLVAGITVRWDVHITTGMAIHALQRHMRAGQWKLGLIMVEGRRRPGGGGVTFRTLKAEIIRRMIWFDGGSEVLLMAVVTSGGDGAVARRMAINTLNRYMRAGQRKVGEIMIESDRLPRSFIVTCHAIGRKRIRHMIGIGNGVVVVFVTAETFLR